MYAYFDIGGTKTRVAVSHDGKSFEEPKKFDTPHDIENLYKAIHDTAHELGGDGPIEAAGGGIACSFNRSTNKLGWGPNLPEDWFKHDMVQELGTKLSCPVFMDNDTAVIGVGEALHGAGQDCEILVYITISTGVGGARIINGKSESVGMSSEPGRQYIDIDNTICPKCETGNTQKMLSGASMEDRFEMKPYEVTDPAVWERMAKWTAYMLNNTIIHWAPDVIVLGGSMVIGDPAISIDRIREHLKPILRYEKMPEIKEAGLGDFGGIYGAMEFVNQRITQ